jgi:hypothetical protein
MIRASFNPAPLKRALQNQSRGLQATLPEQLRRAGRLVAVSLATSTQPYGDNDAARILGEKATARDIHRVYATPAQVYSAIGDQKIAAGFWKAVSAGAWSKAQAIINKFCPAFAGVPIGKALDPSLHRGARDRRGRISEKQRPLQIVSPGQLKGYTNQEVGKVGLGKSGWAICAKILGGTRGIPQWVTRHNKISSGTVIEDRNPTHPTITLRNELSYAEQILSEADKAEAVQIGMERLAKALITEEYKLARQHALA